METRERMSRDDWDNLHPDEDPEFVVCYSCDNWMRFGGWDIQCDACGDCAWEPADAKGEPLYLDSKKSIFP